MRERRQFPRLPTAQLVHVCVRDDSGRRVFETQGRTLDLSLRGIAVEVFTAPATRSYDGVLHTELTLSIGNELLTVPAPLVRVRPLADGRWELACSIRDPVRTYRHRLAELFADAPNPLR